MNILREEPYGSFSERVFERSAQQAQALRAQIEITYRCNIHCVHCYTDPYNNPTDLRRELTLPEWLRLFDQLAEAGVLWITLTGGEAFTHPQFKAIYRATKERGFLIALYTNGTTVTDDLADYIAADPPFKIEVSLHGSNAQTFDRITQVNGSYERFTAGLQRLLSRRLPVKIKSKAMTLNREDWPALKAFVESQGLDFNFYTTLYPRLNGDVSSTQYRLSAAEILALEFEPQTEDEENLCAAASPAPNGPPDDRLFRCGCGTNTATINPYGVMRPCTFTTWPTYDLRHIPFGEAFQRLANDVHQARYTTDSACRQCSAFQLCEKNPVSALAEVGSMEAPVPDFCDVAFARQAKLFPKGSTLEPTR